MLVVGDLVRFRGGEWRLGYFAGEDCALVVLECCGVRRVFLRHEVEAHGERVLRRWLNCGGGLSGLRG